MATGAFPIVNKQEKPPEEKGEFPTMEGHFENFNLKGRDSDTCKCGESPYSNEIRSDINSVSTEGIPTASDQDSFSNEGEPIPVR